VSNQLAKVLLYHGRPEEIGRPLAEHVKRDAFVRGVFERLESKRMHLLDPTPYFCGKTEFCRAVEDGRSLYIDYDHLNMYGAKKLRPLFEPVIRAIADERASQRMRAADALRTDDQRPQ
jgi:hypothetical protein